MNGAKDFPGALHQWRAGRVQQFVANDHNPPILHGRDILPCRIGQRAGRVRTSTGSGPGKDNGVWNGAGNLVICDTFSRRDYKFAARELN